MEHNCERHTFEVAEGVCRSCRGSFCPDCLLYPFGPDAEPFCKPCAIAAGGVRSTAGNPRRQTAAEPPTKAKSRSGGLLRRLRRGSEPDDGDEDEPLTREEALEREVAEARAMLDAQRLPSEADEEPEPDLPPTPDIAPPGGGSDRELAHRRLPDEIAGGLDLGGIDDRFDRGGAEQASGDDTVAPVPDPAPVGGAGDRPDPPDPPGPPDPPRPAAMPEPAVPAASAEGSDPGPAQPRDPADESDPGPAGPTDPVPDAPSDPAEPVPATATATGALTADGTPLFASAPPPEERGEDEEEPAPPPDPAPPAEPVPAGAEAFRDDETGELLRRIADIRSR